MKKLIPLLFLLSACTTPTSTPTTDSATTAQAEVTQIAPVDTSKTLTKIAFGSCQRQKQPQPIFASVLAEHPDLYITMGDNVYASKPEDQPISEQYRLQAQVPEFKKLRAEVPIIATWDDHDAGQNDGGDDNPNLPVAKEEFIKFFPYDAKQLAPDEKGVYHSFVFGSGKQRVQVILLDTRTYRSALEKNPAPKNPLDIFQPTKDLKKTFLGEEQWKWLESELKKPAEVRFVVSSVQLIPEEHGFEKWANFPHERTRFFNLLKKTKAKNVIVLSGDRHMAEISELKWPGVGQIYDVTSSGINRVANVKDEKNKHRVGEIFARENFGLAQIDWTNKNVLIEIHDINGASPLRIQQKLK